MLFAENKLPVPTCLFCFPKFKIQVQDSLAAEVYAIPIQNKQKVLRVQESTLASGLLQLVHQQGWKRSTAEVALLTSSRKNWTSADENEKVKGKIMYCNLIIAFGNNDCIAAFLC